MADVLNGRLVEKYKGEYVRRNELYDDLMNSNLNDDSSEDDDNDSEEKNELLRTTKDPGGNDDPLLPLLPETGPCKGKAKAVARACNAIYRAVKTDGMTLADLQKLNAKLNRALAKLNDCISKHGQQGEILLV